uniref:Thioredoxin domain-containing protein 9 homolog n=1 Tax=Dermatophagoides pteronyssinus TaxID=6956 RepID=A0A6P6XLS3_DERPT|nr:thioredoxin domain-containing protein 9 homolog [Dermatophagoides pteronyssinus]
MTEQRDYYENERKFAQLENAVSKNLMNALRAKEEELDSELNAIQNLNDDDFEKIQYNRKKRLLEKYKRDNHWRSLGHGELTECTSDTDFFTISENSPLLVVHCFKNDIGMEYSEYLNVILESLAKKRLDIKFIKLNVERHPFLVSTLNVFVIPTVLLIKQMKVIHRLVGFDEMGGSVDFSEADFNNLLNSYRINEKFLTEKNSDDDEDA